MCARVDASLETVVMRRWRDCCDCKRRSDPAFILFSRFFRSLPSLPRFSTPLRDLLSLSQSLVAASRASYEQRQRRESEM